MIPSLPPGVRLHWDAVRGRPVLLAPERVLMLDAPAHAILARIDGRRAVADLAAELAAAFDAPIAEIEADVAAFLAELARERLVDLDG